MGSSNSRIRGSVRAWAILSGLAALAVLALGVACAVGSVPLSPAQLWAGAGDLMRGAAGGISASLLQLRLVRGLVALATGGSLALAGVMMQALLRNPLADPYVLGVSGGAAVGALGAMLFVTATWLIDLAAFGGAIAVSLLLLLLAARDLRNAGGGNASVLLLTGVIVASGCGALVTLILTLAPDDRMRGMVFWLIGDLSGLQSGWQPIFMLGAVLAAALAYVLPRARAINVLTLHADVAATLGVSTGRLATGLFVCAALLTAGAVGTAGAIGFVGLIVPHACRFALGSDHRLLLPAATLAGGTFLVLADTLGRCVLAPLQLPVGAITALIGAPVFLLQLHRLRNR